MQAVVTGGAGFIGSHVVDRLLDFGHRVRVIDNLATGRADNLAGHANDPRLEVEIADVRERTALARMLKGADWVFHLAALADIVPSVERPDDYHSANVDGTFAVLEEARAAGIKRLVYASSSSCYGFADVFPTPETAPARPMYPYALTKWIGEQYVLHWTRVYALPGIALRLFNVYGPRSRTTGAYGAVFGVFLAQKFAGKPYTVVGDGNQTRDFTYVTDVADAFVRAAESDLSGEVMNVGSGGTYSINRLVDLLGGEKVNIPKRPGEPDCTFADISKIRRLLGWEPSVPFEQGVAVMMERINLWRDAPVWDAESIARASKTWFDNLGRTASVKE